MPYGFDVSDPQTKTGTTLGLRALQCLSWGRYYGVPGWLETPFSSRLKSLPPFKVLRHKPGVDFCRTDSCQFGSTHQKSFAFLSVWPHWQELDVDAHAKESMWLCPAPSQKPVQCTDDLAEALAQVLIDWNQPSIWPGEPVDRPGCFGSALGS